MIVFEKLIMQNFLSYGNEQTEINLNTGKAVLVTGINYDASVNGELDSNGCGKSTILNAIAYALYNKTISITENLDELINNVNLKDMLVILYFSVNKKRFRVSRFRKNKAMGGTAVLIEEERGKNWKDITTTKPEPQIANEILKLPFTIFNRIIGYAAGEEPFLKQGLAKQREVIDELFDYVELSNRATKLKEVLKNLKKDLEYAEKSNDEIKAERKRHEDQIANLQERKVKWDEKRDRDVSDLEERLRLDSTIDFDEQNRLFENISIAKKSITELRQKKSSLEKDLGYIETEISKFNSFDVDRQKKLNKQKASLEEIRAQGISVKEQRVLLAAREELSSNLSKVKSEIASISSEIQQTEKRKRKMLDELEHLNDSTCPYCKQQFEESKEKTKELENIIVELDSKLLELQGEIEKVGDVQEIEKSLLKIDDNLIFNSEYEINTFENSILKLDNSIKELEDSTNPFEDKSDEADATKEEINAVSQECTILLNELETMESATVFSNERELQATILSLETNERKLEELVKEENPYESLLKEAQEYEPKENKDAEIEQLRVDIKHCDFLIKLLTKKDSYLRKALMDKYLPLLNKRIHHYLSVMALPHKVLFRSDLAAEISQFGRKIPYGNLSAGQKARINIALSLAFRDVLQAKHNFINLYVLDECLDTGLSNVGVKKTVKAIKEVAKTNKLSMFVITHRDEAKSSFPGTLEIELRNGFSTIKKAL